MSENECKNGSKLAIFVPTYGRPGVIDELLRSCIKLYQSLHIDLYIYDSNIDDQTKKITEAYQADFDNLFYVRLPSDMHSNMKVYRIYQKYGWVKEYAYVWVCTDALRLSRSLLERVIDKTAATDGDDIMVAHYISQYCSAREYTDKNSFFYDCAWQVTMYGGAILNVRTMLDQVPWAYLTEKYNVPEMVNFSHVGFYFEKIMLMTRFNACRLKVDPYDFRSSALKKEAGWFNDTFLTWLCYWPNTIKALPDFYNNKTQVIKSLGIYSDLFSGGCLTKLRKKGVLTKKVYGDYKSVWKKYSGQRGLTLFLYTYAPLPCLVLYQHKKDVFKYVKRRLGLLKLEAFCQKNSVLYIYGTGRVAARYAGYLKGWGVEITAFVVTDLSAQKAPCFYDRPIIDITSLPNKADIGLILGLNQRNAMEVRVSLDACQFSGHLFSVYIP